MIKEDSLKNNEQKYSEMLMQLLDEFDKRLPVDFTLEDSIELGIDAWNLANKKDFLMIEELYEKELKTYIKFPIFEEMINYKIANFSENKDMIVDYSLVDDILNVKCQTEEDYFNTIVRNMIDTSDEE
jgi:hypothetical protein